jgi:hypothetical protein
LPKYGHNSPEIVTKKNDSDFGFCFGFCLH